ncbi:MAG: XisI protein [Anaerolineae bacterium]|nr:XisI protein [Anaerolineae bacterium]
MERVASLLQILKDEMNWYHQAHGYKNTSHFFYDEVAQKYLIVVVPDHDYPPALLSRGRVNVMMMAHIDGEYIVVDADNTDKPLYEGLMHAGIPREKIILAYAGERVPTSQAE